MLRRNITRPVTATCSPVRVSGSSPCPSYDARTWASVWVRSTVTGDIDLNGILGLNPNVRNGYAKINVRFAIKGDASDEKLRQLVEQSTARSAVYDVITNGVPVDISVDIL